MKPERFTAGVFVILVAGMMCLSFSSAFMRIKEKVDADSQIMNILTVNTINWEELYPFPETAGKTAPVKIAGKMTFIYDYVKGKAEQYTSENLPGYYEIAETAKKYEDVIGWNMASVFEYNAVITLKDGYLTGYVMSFDVAPDAESVKNFADFCAEKGVSFFYVNIPAKVCISEDSDISGVLDFANQNADRFLAMLTESGVRNYDFRTMLHEAGRGHHESFFRTDHHWKPETGLWAAGEVLKILRDDLGWDVEPGIIAPENFEYEVYRDWFLGSQGKKVTLARTTPDDFTMIYPKFATSLHFEVPSLGVNVSGDFRITYDMSEVVSRDYYGKNSHKAYSYGRQPMHHFTNMKCGNSRKILVLYDSMSDTVLPFVALGVSEIYTLDLRQFTGSVKSVFEAVKPEAVIVMYLQTAPGAGVLPSATKENKKFYDFR